MKAEWQQVTPDTQRLKVFGGWLVRIDSNVYHTGPEGGDSWDWRPAITHVPDLNHEWTIDTEGEE